MRIKDWLFPQDKLFFELLTKQFAMVAKASEILYQAIIKNKFNQKTIGKIEQLENEGDRLVHRVFTRLNQTFIAPLDHEDIGRLVIAGDNLLDLIFVISRRLEIYKINLKNKNLEEAVLIVKKMIAETGQVILKTRSLRQELLLSHARRIHRLENQADDLVIENLRRVFQKKDIRQLIKEKEIYELLEVLTDKIESFCDLIQGVVTKNL